MRLSEEERNKNIRERQIERMIRGLDDALRTYSHMITVCAEATDEEMYKVRYLIEDCIDSRLALRDRGNTDAEELDFVLRGLDRMHRMTAGVIKERRLAIKKENGRAIDYVQAKYGMETVGNILGVTKATVNNWSRKKGGYIRAFEFSGMSKFVLEEDLVKKYEEMFGRTLLVDSQFRETHEYKPNPRKLRDAIEGL